MSKEEPRMLVADTSFATQVDGVDFTFNENETRVWSDDPVVRGREHLFRELEAHRPRSLWERATAAPNEKRGRAKEEPKVSEEKKPENPQTPPEPEKGGLKEEDLPKQPSPGKDEKA